MDHELNGAGPLFVAVLLIHNRYGDKIAAAIDKMQDVSKVGVSYHALRCVQFVLFRILLWEIGEDYFLIQFVDIGRRSCY